MKLKIMNFKSFFDHTGCLAPFYQKKSLLNFKIKRFFFLYGNVNSPRADHAHKICNQILIPINGKIKVEITKKNKNKKIFFLSRINKKYLIVPKFNWIKLFFLEKNSILLTLCDYKYSKKEYIQSKKEFFNL